METFGWIVVACISIGLWLYSYGFKQMNRAYTSSTPLPRHIALLDLIGVLGLLVVILHIGGIL